MQKQARLVDIEDRAAADHLAPVGPPVSAPVPQKSLLARFALLAGKVLLPVLVVAAGVAVFSYLKATKAPVAQQAKSETVWFVRSQLVQFTDIRPSLTLFGETVAGRQVELRALVSGQVISTSPSLREGAIIEAGETLLTIDPFDYEGALTDARSRLAEAQARLSELEAGLVSEQDSLKRDRAQLLLAERDLERAQPLVSRGTVSQKAVDDRQVTVNQRRQTVEQRQSALKAQVARIDQQRAIIPRLEWGVRQAERQLELTALRAPFGGYLSEPSAEVGRMMNVNDRVALLLDRQQIDVRFTLSDQQFGRIAAGEIATGGEAAGDGPLIGREVDVYWRVGDAPLIYRARVERVGAKISAASGGIWIYARIENALEPVPIREGAFVEVHIADKTFAKAVKLPEAAIYRGNTVYAIVGERIEERTVEVIGHYGSEVLVRGALSDGDRVVSTRLSAPASGLLVKELQN